MLALGSDEQKERYLPDLCAGRKLGAFGLTEPEAGSDAGNVRTRATLDGGSWTINGAKQFITNAGTDISGHVAITARTGENEISNLIVERGTPGYEAGEPAIFDRNINGWVRIPKSMTLPDNQQDRDMLARELLVRFQTSPHHPLMQLNKAYRKF